MSQSSTVSHSPTVSVITVVKNGAATIRDCIESVISQDYPVEHVFVDSVSNDSTVDVIKQYASDTSRVVSEPDDGIYDAMNKGISLTTGEVVGTLNCDDFYAHDGVISTIAAAFLDPGVDACYGDIVYVDPHRTEVVLRNWKSQPVSDRILYRGWMPPHPTLFVRRAVYERFGGFRTDLGTAADYELTLRFFLKYHIRSVYIPELLVVMRAGGAGNATLRNRLLVNYWVYKAWRINGLKPKPWTIPARLLSKGTQYYSGRFGANRLEYRRRAPEPGDKPCGTGE
jgi:glycosyltransferase involved in cell wall biosynthesis